MRFCRSVSRLYQKYFPASIIGLLLVRCWYQGQLEGIERTTFLRQSDGLRKCSDRWDIRFLCVGIGCLLKRPTFESVEWLKISSQQWDSHHLIFLSPPPPHTHQRKQREGKFPLYLSWDNHLLLHSKFGILNIFFCYVAMWQYPVSLMDMECLGLSWLI